MPMCKNRVFNTMFGSSDFGSSDFGVSENKLKLVGVRGLLGTKNTKYQPLRLRDGDINIYEKGGGLNPAAPSVMLKCRHLNKM